MANMTELQLQGDSTVYKLNDARVTTTSVTTATHILTTNSGVTSIAPITAANLASVLGDKYVTTIKQTSVNHWVKITRQQGASALVTIEMGGDTQAVYLITFNDSASSFNQDVKLLFKRGTNTISWKEDSDGNLYFISQYGNSRGHSVISLTGQIFEAQIAASYSGTTPKNVIDTTYLDSYSSLANLASALGGSLKERLVRSFDYETCKTWGTGLYFLFGEGSVGGRYALVYVAHPSDGYAVIPIGDTADFGTNEKQNNLLYQINSDGVKFRTGSVFPSYIKKLM